MTDEQGLDVSYLCRPYERYAVDLRRVRAYQRALAIAVGYFSPCA